MKPRARWLWPLALALSVLAFALGAEARPGGGHTFGGGASGSDHSYGSRSSGGGSSDGGDAELVFWIIRLIFAYPKLGIPVVLVLLFLWFRAKNSAPESWTSSHAAAPVPRADYGVLLAADPDFSRVVLDDFVVRLYATAQRSRHDASALAALAPYLSEGVRQGLARDASQGAVSHVVVGALRTLSVSQDAPSEPGQPGPLRILLELETNLTVSSGPSARTDYVVERWALSRAFGVRTKPPEETARLGCPSCGAPLSASDTRRCAYCGQVADDGRFAWSVIQRDVVRREARPPALTGNTPEAGTDTPSVRDPECAARFAELQKADPALDPAALEARLTLIYDALNRGWSAADLSAVRGLVSDGMFDYLRYWVEAYVAQGLRNQLREMRIARVERVKVVRDRYFDAVTYRLWASGYDSTVDAKTGAPVGGSDSVKRAYTEYWTLIRARGVASSPSPRRDASCPSCGAPLDVTMAGACKHCGSHVTRGEFDWVLSKIEQDDVYAG